MTDYWKDIVADVDRKPLTALPLIDWTHLSGSSGCSDRIDCITKLFVPCQTAQVPVGSKSNDCDKNLLHEGTADVRCPSGCNCSGPASSNAEGEGRAAGAHETKEGPKRRNSVARGGYNKRQNTGSNHVLVFDALMELQQRQRLVIETCTRMAMLEVHNFDLDLTPQIKPFVTKGRFEESEYIWNIRVNERRYGEIATVFNAKVNNGRPGEQNLTETINSNAKKYLLYHFGIVAGPGGWNTWKRAEWRFCYEKACKQANDTKTRNAASRNTA